MLFLSKKEIIFFNLSRNIHSQSPNQHVFLALFHTHTHTHLFDLSQGSGATCFKAPGCFWQARCTRFRSARSSGDKYFSAIPSTSLGNLGQVGSCDINHLSMVFTSKNGWFFAENVYYTWILWVRSGWSKKLIETHANSLVNEPCHKSTNYLATC